MGLHVHSGDVVVFFGQTYYLDHWTIYQELAHAGKNVCHLDRYVDADCAFPLLFCSSAKYCIYRFQVECGDTGTQRSCLG